MLAALETGVKGGCWFSLMDKVYSLKNLWSAWAKSAKNNGAPGVDGITIDRFEKRCGNKPGVSVGAVEG
jgi:RNA-directed DNA polymerase